MAEPAGEDAAALGRDIAARLETLAAISDDPAGLTRLTLSPAHRRAADLVAGWMATAGMSVRYDPLGTLVGRYEGQAAGLPALYVGSHIDTVRNAGRFDGNLGVIAAIAVIERFHRADLRFAFAIEVLAFGDEEGVRFATTLSGSKAIAGWFDPAILAEADRDGITRRQALQAFGCDPASDPTGFWRDKRALGYLEMHIEQGPVLEREALPVGVVTAIAGASRGHCTVNGQAGHAGTVPMDLRQDALVAASMMIVAIEAIARATPGLVATVGQITVTDGAINTVPGAVTFTLDVRSADDVVRHAACAEIAREIAAIASRRNVSAVCGFSYDAPAAPCDDGLCDAMATAIGGAGLAVRRLPSGAGHDAMAFRGVLPMAMMFVRCRGGISHHPDEFAAPHDIGVAAQCLAATIRILASRQLTI